MKAQQYAVAMALLGITSCTKNEPVPERFDVFTKVITRPIEGVYDCTIVTSNMVLNRPQSAQVSQQVITITKKDESSLLFQQPSNAIQLYTYRRGGDSSEFFYEFLLSGTDSFRYRVGFNKGDSLFFRFQDGLDLRNYTLREGRGKRRP